MTFLKAYMEWYVSIPPSHTETMQRTTILKTRRCWWYVYGHMWYQAIVICCTTSLSNALPYIPRRITVSVKNEITYLSGKHFKITTVDKFLNPHYIAV